jgi:hypothetical protein
MVITGAGTPALIGCLQQLGSEKSDPARPLELVTASEPALGSAVLSKTV